MTLPDGFAIAPMRDDEISQLADWAAAEGWNPGLADVAVAKRADPDCFVALRQGSELAGGGSIFSYGGRFGFMGLFIMRPDLRNKGLGTALWHWRRDRLLERLAPDAAIGMDGVFDMVPLYERGGFTLAYRHLRFEGVAEGRTEPRVVSLEARDFARIAAFDHDHFPAPRETFLQGWVTQPGAHVLGLPADGALQAYGVARPCRVGYKIGPLFATSAESAEIVLNALADRVSGSQIQIDIPEINDAAMRLVETFGLTMSFGCARMYYRAAPKLKVDEIFGVTSLEFG